MTEPEESVRLEQHEPETVTVDSASHIAELLGVLDEFLHSGTDVTILLTEFMRRRGRERDRNNRGELTGLVEMIEEVRDEETVHDHGSLDLDAPNCVGCMTERVADAVTRAVNGSLCGRDRAGAPMDPQAN